MSETPPVPPTAARPAGPKRASRILWFGVCTILVALWLIFVVLPGIGGAPPRKLNSAYIGDMSIALRVYSNDHGGRLPEILWALIPNSLSQEGYEILRYVGEKKGERYDWLYFPHDKFDGLSRDTILLAAPGTIPDSAGKPQRLVFQAEIEPHSIPEADFQRLIREQNPPPAPR